MITRSGKIIATNVMAGNNTFAIDGINNAITGTKKEAAVATIGKCTAIGCK